MPTEYASSGDVVAVAAGQRHRERDAPAVDEDVVLAARSRAVDRAGSALGTGREARTWVESITALDQSSCPADRSLRSSTRWSRSHTPTSFQVASLCQQVMPEPKPSSCSRYSHWMPACSTNRTPCRQRRSFTGRGPGDRSGHSGNRGSIRAHRSSPTIHGLLLTPSRTDESSHRSRPTSNDQQDPVTSSTEGEFGVALHGLTAGAPK